MIHGTYTRDKVIGVVFGLIILGIIIYIFIYIVSLADPIQLENNQKITNEKCCGGINNYCTDVYYDKKDNLCHSTFVVGELLRKNYKSFWWSLIPVGLSIGVAIILLLILRYRVGLSFVD